MSFSGDRHVDALDGYTWEVPTADLSSSAAVGLSSCMEGVIFLNSTKSSPDLGLPRSISDLLDYSVHPRSPDLGPISDYSDHP